MFKISIALAVLLFGTVAHSQSWNSLHWCPKYSGRVFSVTAGDRWKLKGVIDAYRAALGGDDNGSNEGQKDGHRSINWDAPGVPFNMPGNFFKNTVTRGAEFLAVDGKFAVSNPPSSDPSGIYDNRFSSFHKDFPHLFRTFSPKRLFTPVNSNELITVFSVPASKHADKAKVSGFGAVFTNVALPKTSFLNFYDENECLIVRLPVKELKRGLSFAGIVVTHKNGRKVKAAVASVKITLGNGIISKPQPRKNFVVLDDLIYGEPQKI